MRTSRPHTSIIVVLSLVILTSLSGCLSPFGSRKQPPPPPRVYFPAPPVTPRVQFLCGLSGARQFAVKQNWFLSFLIGEQKEKYSVINKPFGVAMRDGRIYVADTMATCIAVMDHNTSTFSAFGKRGKGALRKPINVRTGPHDRLYVSDTLRRQVVAFDGMGRFVSEYGDGKEFKPADAVVWKNELFVLDIEDHDIKVYNVVTHKLIRTIGKHGIEPGEFNYPTNLALDSEGFLYVSDSLNFRIQKLQRDGTPVFHFGQAGRNPGHFARPKGLAVARDGMIYVVDSVMGIVQLFDEKGEPLMHFGGTGTGGGELVLPAQVTLDYDNIEVFRKYIAPDFEIDYLILVTSQLHANKVSVYAFGNPTGFDPALQPTVDVAPATQESAAKEQPKPEPQLVPGMEPGADVEPAPAEGQEQPAEPETPVAPAGGDE